MTAWAWALILLGVVLALALVGAVLIWLHWRWLLDPKAPPTRSGDRPRVLVACGLCGGTGKLRRGTVTCPSCDGDGLRIAADIGQ